MMKGDRRSRRDRGSRGKEAKHRGSSAPSVPSVPSVPYTHPMRLVRLHRLTQWGLLFLLAFSILWKGGKTIEMTWLLVGVAWLVVILHWMRRKQEKRDSDEVSSIVWLLAIGFAVWTGLSFLTSSTQNYGLDEVLREGSLALLFLTTVREARANPAFMKRILTVIAFCACVTIPIGIAVYALQPVNRFVGTFFDARYNTDYWPNAWAEFALLAWPIVAWWMLQTQDRKTRLVRFLILGVLIGTLFLSFSRGAVLVFAVQLFLAAFLFALTSGSFHLRRAWNVLRPQLGRITTVLLVGFVTFLLINILRGQFFEVESVARKVTFTAAEGISSVSERSQFWRQAFVLAKDHPLTGYGPYSFRFLQPRMQTGVYETSDHAHNVFLKLAMERGWPAAILFFLFLVIVMLRALAVIARGPPTRSLHVSLVFLAIAGVLVHNLLDYNLQFVGIVLPLWLLLAVIESEQTGKSLSRIKRYLRMSVEVVIMSALLVVALSEGRYLVLSSLGRHAEASGDSAAAIDWYTAARGEIYSRDMHLSHAELLMQGKHWEEALAALDDYFQQNSEDARAWKMRGDIRRAQDDLATAEADYEGAYLRGRYNYLTILEGTLLLWRDRDNKEAMETWKDDVFVVLEHFAQAIESNTHFIALSDNVETFLRVTKIAGQLYPDRAATLDILSATVDRNAKEVRSAFSARKPGKLW